MPTLDRVERLLVVDAHLTDLACQRQAIAAAPSTPDALTALRILADRADMWLDRRLLLRKETP